MELVIIVIRDEQRLHETMTVLAEVGAVEANVFNVEAVTEVLAAEIPLFAGLRSLLEGEVTVQKAIFAILEDERMFNRMVKHLQEEGMDFSQPDVGAIISLPVNRVIRWSEGLP